MPSVLEYPEIEYISPDAFYETDIDTVYFKGTEEDWLKHPPINEKDTLVSLFNKQNILFEK